MTAQEMWRAYCAVCPSVADASYEAWPFGSDDPDLLASLTLSGQKTATASAYPCYLNEHCPLPRVGDHSVILSTSGEALCVIRTEQVDVTPFSEVSERHAWLEGEGDRTLRFWREVHASVFAAELAEFGATFTPEMPVVCERFTRVYPLPTDQAEPSDGADEAASMARTNGGDHA